MSHFHAVVWMDHAEAKVFPFNADDFETRHIASHGAGHLHHKAGAVGAGHAKADPKFLEDVAATLKHISEILVIGPGSAKDEFMAYAQAKNPALAKKIMAVQAADHPSDRQIVAQGRAYFKVADKMLPR
jgi:stalled ribosome rescue protein Dom34